MTRVQESRATSVPAGAGATRHKLAEHHKNPYHVVYEEVSEKKKLRTYLTFNEKPPPGYIFIPAGDPQLTKRCKLFTRRLDMTAYLVSGGSKSMVLSKEINQIGYHFSRAAVEKACESLGVTLNSAGRVQQSQFAAYSDQFRDDKSRQHPRLRRQRPGNDGGAASLDDSMSQAVVDSMARDAIVDLFPKIPERDLREVIVRAFDKSKGLIGTVEGYPLARRANLAVGAHIRHMYTNYDELLKSGMSRVDARRGIEHFTLDKLVSWRGREEDDDTLMEDVLREVIVISDDECDSDNADDTTVSLAHRLPRKQASEDIGQNAFSSECIDLTQTDDEDESDDDLGTYQHHLPKSHDLQGQSSVQAARYEQFRQAKWAEAVKRQKRNRTHASTTDDFQTLGAYPPSKISRAKLEDQPTSEVNLGHQSSLFPTSLDALPGRSLSWTAQKTQHRSVQSSFPGLASENDSRDELVGGQNPFSTGVYAGPSRSANRAIQESQRQSTNRHAHGWDQAPPALPQASILPSVEVDHPQQTFFLERQGSSRRTKMPRSSALLPEHETHTTLPTTRAKILRLQPLSQEFSEEHEGTSTYFRSPNRQVLLHEGRSKPPEPIEIVNSSTSRSWRPDQAEEGAQSTPMVLRVSPDVQPSPTQSQKPKLVRLSGTGGHDLHPQDHQRRVVNAQSLANDPATGFQDATRFSAQSGAIPLSFPPGQGPHSRRTGERNMENPMQAPPRLVRLGGTESTPEQSARKAHDNTVRFNGASSSNEPYSEYNLRLPGL